MTNNFKRVIFGASLFLLSQYGEAMNKESVNIHNIIDSNTLITIQKVTNKQNNTIIDNNPKAINNVNTNISLNDIYNISVNNNASDAVKLTGNYKDDPKLYTSCTPVVARIEKINQDDWTVFADYIEKKYKDINNIMKQSIKTIEFDNNFAQYKPINYDIIYPQQSLPINKKYQKRLEKEFYYNHNQAVTQIKLKQHNTVFKQNNCGKSRKNLKRHIISNTAK